MSLVGRGMSVVLIKTQRAHIASPAMCNSSNPSCQLPVSDSTHTRTMPGSDSDMKVSFHITNLEVNDNLKAIQCQITENAFHYTH